MESERKEALGAASGLVRCGAYTRTGRPCSQNRNIRWLVGDDGDSVPVCDHHAALARRLGWPLRKMDPPNAERSATAGADGAENTKQG